ncbi:MAG TPA: SPOR domain-containing protein [Candidatus Eisenbacteria bacterium]
MTRPRLPLITAAAVAASLLLVSFAAGAPRKGTARASARPADVERLNSAVAAFDHGRVDEARTLLASVNVERLPRERLDDADYLKASLAARGTAYDQGLDAYLTGYPRGAHRREATLALAKLRYVQGDYAKAENLLTLFSPGVEKDAAGREALVLRGLAQLARGDAPGALQFLASAEGDLKGTAQEEAYYFATSQAALRAGRPNLAVDALRVILDRHAQGDYAPQALYAMGVCLEALGRQSDAATVFRQVAQRFPGSYEATRVRDRGIRSREGASSSLPIGGGFAIQVGAFSRRELAESLAKDLRQAGVGDVSVKQGSEPSPVYRVRAGSFASRDEARALGERLRRERGFSYTIVPR